MRRSQSPRSRPLARWMPVAALCLLLGLSAAFVASSTPAEAGPSMDFKEHGFKWTLADDWKFEPPTPEARKAGYVAKAVCTMASLEVYIYTAPTDGLDVAGRVKDVKSAGSMGLGSVNRTVISDATLSGVKGKAVVMKIDANGNAGYFRTTIIESGGKFYQMLIRAWHGAQIDETDALNEVRKGFRLLEGAGGDDEDLPFDEFDEDEPAKKKGGADAGGANGGDDEGTDPNWPPGGAAKDGRKISLPNHNIEWTLPEGPFQWTDAPIPATAESGVFVVARAKVERVAKQEFEKDKPPSVARLELLIRDMPTRLKVNTWVKSTDAQETVKNWGLFDTIDATKTRTFEDKKIGNVDGAILKLEGKKNGKPTMLFLFAVALRGKLYFILGSASGASDVYKHMRKDIGDSVKGVNFLETDELMAGPLLGAVPDFAWIRGTDADEEKEIKGPRFTFKKPKGLGIVKVRDSMNREIRFTGEMRTKDGDAYFYVEIRQYRLNIANTPNPEEEKFVNKRGEDWTAGAGENADVGRGKGDLGKKGSFNGAKGLTYEFTGDLDGIPFLEEGYVVKHKDQMFWIKFQYGGEGAEKKLKSFAKKVKKGIKFTK